MMLYLFYTHIYRQRHDNDSRRLRPHLSHDNSHNPELEELTVKTQLTETFVRVSCFPRNEPRGVRKCPDNIAYVFSLHNHVRACICSKCEYPIRDANLIQNNLIQKFQFPGQRVTFCGPEIHRTSLDVYIILCVVRICIVCVYGHLIFTNILYKIYIYRLFLKNNIKKHIQIHTCESRRF